MRCFSLLCFSDVWEGEKECAPLKRHTVTWRQRAAVHGFTLEVHCIPERCLFLFSVSENKITRKILVSKLQYLSLMPQRIKRSPLLSETRKCTWGLTLICSLCTAQMRLWRSCILPQAWVHLGSLLVLICKVPWTLCFILSVVTKLRCRISIYLNGSARTCIHFLILHLFCTKSIYRSIYFRWKRTTK